MSPNETGLGPQASGVRTGLYAGPAVDVASRANERRFKLLWASVLVIVLAGLSLSAYSEYRTATLHAERAVSDSALVLKQHMSRYFESADLIMRHTAFEVSHHGWSDWSAAHADTGATVNEMLELDTIAADTGWVENLWLLDAAGTVRHALRPEETAAPERSALADAAAAAMDEPGTPVFAEPVAGRFMDWPSFLVARAIEGREGGSPTGAVVLSVAGDSLADVFSQQVLGPRGSVALVRTDGVVLAHYPSTPGASGTALSEGPLRQALRTGVESLTLRSEALPDGRDRIASYARVDGLPLAAVATHAAADLRARLLSALWPQYLLAGVIVAGLLGFYPFMMRRLRFERKAARDLAERELLFRSILNNVGVGLGLTAADGTVRFANTVFDRLLGYEPGGLTGRNIEDLTHPDDRLSTMYRISRMEALGPAGLSYEKRYLRRDGTAVEALVTLSLKPRVGEQEPLLVGVIQDLTEQRAREKAIAFQNSLLRIQQEASPDALLVTDADGRLRSWNSRFRAMWDVPEALLSAGGLLPVLRHIASHVAPGTPETTGEADQAGWLRRALTDGRVIDTLESELRDGTGASIGRVWFFRDVSERLAAETAVRESEARYRALVEQSPEAIVVHSDDRVLFANSAARSLFGYADPADWPAEATVSAMVAPAVRDYVRSAIRASATEPWNGIQEDLQRRDGSLFDAWIISAPIRVNDQPASQAVIRPLDAGQGVRGRLMQTAKMATLGQMAASVAHELSQPLNILSMGLEGIRLQQTRTPLAPDDLDAKLEQATRQCGRMAEIIDHIRVFSRSSKGRHVRFDAAGPLRGAADMMRPVFEREEIELVIDLPAQLGVVEGSPLDLEQVVINLLKNAFDALQESRRRLVAERPADWCPRVTVVGQPEPESRRICVEVADTGPGIPDALLDDIFEPFFTTKTEGLGTGLGLSICMSTISRMGGTLRPANRDGAVFTIRLPLSGDNGPGAETPATAASAPPPAVVLNGAAGVTAASAAGPTGHVLLMEPEEATRQTLAVILIERGFRVTTAASVPEAEGKARLDPPQVLLAALPPAAHGDGVKDLLHRLRHRNPALATVLLAGEETAQDAAAALPGVTAVLDRPVEAARLLSALHAALATEAGAS
ncbi:PAS domain S-box protein [Caenispirillum salinarum]|uniref:PAS domain S-box protein n=1 Tax=Caenispirillum salinarum TaxID=859058 RepID=UPI003850EA43